MPTISDISTEKPGSTSDLIGNIGSTTKRFTIEQTKGAMNLDTTDQPQFKGVTVSDGSTAGRVNLFSSVGLLAVITNDGNDRLRIVQDDGSVWAALPTTGSSGEFLQTTGGIASWVSVSGTSGIAIGFSGLSSKTLHHETTNVLAMPWDIPIYDNGDMHSSITSTLITVPAGSSGIYIIHLNAVLGGASSYTGLRIVAGGSTFDSERIQTTGGGLLMEMTAVARIDGEGTIITYSRNLEGSTLEVVPVRVSVQNIGQF